MELFAVNRYTAEKSENPKNEDEILSNLMKKVEKRKRKQKVEPEKSKKAPITSSAEDTLHEEKKIKVVEQESVEAEDDLDLITAGTTAPALELETSTEAASGFEALGEDVDFAKRQKVAMVLPPWLAHPTIISTSLSASEDPEKDDGIGNLPFIAPYMRHALKELNVTRLFPVQSAVIPWILEAHAKPTPFRPRDICVSAPTGSGKTLAFAVPIVQLLANRVQPKIRALIVLPVAELALQIFKVFKKLCEKTDLTVCLLSRQFAFPLEQEKLVECYKGEHYSKVDIVVTTPGRLVDHLHATKGFCLKSLKFLVIDEADRIMDAVFQNWLYHLDAHVRTTSDQLLSGRAAPLCYNELEQSACTQPHKLLFSATLSQDPEKLQNLRLFQPKLFTSVLTNLKELHENIATSAEQKEQEARGEFIGKYTTPAELTEKYCITESRLKPLTLHSLINEHGWTKFLCFTNSAESSGRLAFVLTELFKKNLIVNELSASINAKERANVLSQFSRGKINGLICSDALARGIDIPEVDIVISYDPPRHIKTYIHRIGRTARAGRQGTAVALLTSKELNTFNQTLAEVGKVITEEINVTSKTEEEHARAYSHALHALRLKLEKDKRTKLLLKERAKDHAKVAQMQKNPDKMTFMEKLQAKATERTLEKVQQKEKLLGAKKNPISKKISKSKKFNASAGKSKKIKK